MDTRPTTEEHGGLNWDQQLAEPEVKSGVMLPPKVSELRKKLGQKAKQEPKFRFYALYDRIYREDVLRIAATLVLNNNGAAGVDGVTCQDLVTLDDPAWNAYIRQLQEELRTKCYRPSAGETRLHPEAGRPAATAGNSDGQGPHRANGGVADPRADL